MKDKIAKFTKRVSAAINILTGSEDSVQTDIENIIQREAEERKERARHAMERAAKKEKAEPVMVHKLKHVVTSANTRIYCDDVEMTKCVRLHVNMAASSGKIAFIDGPISDEVSKLLSKKEFNIKAISTCEDRDMKETVLDINVNLHDGYDFNISTYTSFPETVLGFIINEE